VPEEADNDGFLSQYTFRTFSYAPRRWYTP